MTLMSKLKMRLRSENEVVVTKLKNKIEAIQISKKRQVDCHDFCKMNMKKLLASLW